MIEKGRGLLLYMNQEGRGIGLLNKLKAYKLQEQGRIGYSGGKPNWALGWMKEIMALGRRYSGIWASAK